MLATLAAACASDSTAPAVVASVQVTPPNAQTPIGGTVQLVATPRDASGRNLSGRTVTWSSANPAVATVDGSGMVTGASLGAVQITASSEGKSGQTTVTVIPGPAVQLAFTVQPGNVGAGVAFAPALQVTARDTDGNTATGFTGPVTVALGSNPGGGALAGTTTVAAVAGVATFPGVSVGKTGVGYTLQATATGLPAAASAPFTVTPAPAAQLAFSVQPAPTAAGAAIAPALQVTAHDAFGNTATAFTGAVTIAIANNPAGGTLTGPTTVAAVAGVAMFGGLHIDKAGSGYTLSASATGLTSATSPAFDVLPGAPHHLAFVVPPATTAAGAAFTPAVQVEIRDSLENRVTTATHAVTLAIGTNPAGGALSGTSTQAAVAGVAIFPGVSIDAASAGYTLTAAATGLGAATSAPFTITAGAVSAGQSTVTAAPSSIEASDGAHQSTITVTARDAFGNPVAGAPVVLAATGAGNTLTQPGVTDASGVATGTLSSTAAGGKSVSATVSGVAVTQTASVTVTAGAISQGQSTIGAAPASIVASSGTDQSTITVTARDAFGNPVAGATVVLAASGAGNTLTQPAGLTDASGVATGTISSTVAQSKTITATIGGTAITQTANVTVTPAPATALAFTVQPSDAVAGAAITPAVQVTARDAFGNTATGFTGTVTLAIATNPPGTGVLDGTTSVAAVAGVASFPGVDIDEAGAGYTLTATATGLADALSTTFDITTGGVSAAQSTAAAAPATITASNGANQSTITVTARDDLGNPISGATVVLSASGTGNTLTQPAGPTGAGGVAIGTLSSTVAQSKTVTATIGGTAITQTATVTVQAAAVSASQSTIGAAPASIVASSGTSQSTITVTARDAFGNPVAGATVVLAANGAGNTLTQPAAPTDANGVATGTLSATVAQFKTVTATIGGTAITPTATVTVTPAPATALAFTVQPSDAVAGAAITPAVQVTARDAFGNTATGFTGTVTLAIATNPPGTGVLDGTTSLAAVAGIATFPGLNIDEASAGYTLTAGATGLSGDTTAPFTITVGAAASLALVSGDAQADTVGATLAAPYVVRVTDAVGNGVTGVTVTWAVTGGGGSITPSSITSVTGEAQATRLLGTTAGPQGATASVAGLAGSPVGFTATASAGTTTQLAFAVQPSTAGAGAVITPAVRVAARDGHGNTATSFTGTVTVAIEANPGGGTLSGTTAVAAVGGIATFSTLSIDNVGTGYTLTATSAGLAGATSAAFDVLTGISPTLSTVTAATDTVGQCLRSCQLGLDASRITVTVRDVGGNPVAGVPVTLAATSPDSVLFTNPGASGVTDANGVFAADFRSGQAVAKVVTAVAGGTSLSQAPTVHVMPVLVGAGDIATCAVLSDDAVATLLDSIPGTIFTLGDNAYEHGTATEFTNCYDPTWGRHKARTHAVAGNRDYDTPGATGHYGYFGAAANPSGGTGNDAGFYSFDLGAWHIIALNTEVATASNSAQMAWLLQDLDGRRDQCVIAMWHKPMFGSSSAGSGSAVPLWQASADSGVDIVLNGHAHIYERLAPMDASGTLSAAGTREFIVGTGGISLGGFGSDPPYVETRDKTTHGVLRIVLYPGRYRWQFIPAPGFGSFTDSGTASCN